MFRIDHFGSIAQNTYKAVKTNLLTNGGFEKGDFTGYATTTNWSVVSAPSSDPPGLGKYAAKASEGANSTLETNKVSVTAGNSYMLSYLYGAPNTPKVTLQPNNLVVSIRFFDGSNNFISDYQIRTSRIPGTNKLTAVTKKFTVVAGASKCSIQFKNHHNGGSGKPTATVIDRVRLIDNTDTSVLPFIETIEQKPAEGRQSFSDLRYTHSYRSGFKESTFTLYGSAQYLWNWMQTGLGNHIEIYYNADCVFEGLVWSIEGSINGFGYSLSYDQMFNHIIVKYGKKSKAYQISDPDSQARHGKKMLTDEQNQDSLSKARAKGQSLLLLHANPLPRIDIDKVDPENKLVITCMGYMATTQWLYLPPRFAGLRDTSDIIATLSPSLGDSVLNRIRDESPNDFISNNYDLVSDSNVTTGPIVETEGKTAQDFINDLLDLGTNNGRIMVAGLTQGRKFYMRGRPTVIDYFATPTEDGNLEFRDRGLAIVPRPLVLAGKFVKFGLPIPSLDVPSDVITDAAAVFIKDIEYDAEDDTLRITTPNSDSLDVSLARLFRRRR